MPTLQPAIRKRLTGRELRRRCPGRPWTTAAWMRPVLRASMAAALEDGMESSRCGPPAGSSDAARPSAGSQPATAKPEGSASPNSSIRPLRYRPSARSQLAPVAPWCASGWYVRVSPTRTASTGTVPEGGAPRAGRCCAGVPAFPNTSSTVEPRTAAMASAALTLGTWRPVSTALTRGRERRLATARSVWVRPSARRRSETKFLTRWILRPNPGRKVSRRALFRPGPALVQVQHVEHEPDDRAGLRLPLQELPEAEALVHGPGHRHDRRRVERDAGGALFPSPLDAGEGERPPDALHPGRRKDRQCPEIGVIVRPPPPVGVAGARKRWVVSHSADEAVTVLGHQDLSIGRPAGDVGEVAAVALPALLAQRGGVLLVGFHGQAGHLLVLVGPGLPHRQGQ